MTIVIVNNLSFLQVQFAHVQVTRAYRVFVEQLDRITADDVRWEPYADTAVQARAPGGLSSLCWRDRAFWLTRRKLVYLIYVEDYAPQRVMRQFGLWQPVPVPVGPSLPRHVHGSVIVCTYLLLRSQVSHIT